jgi:hypothetical protein
LFKRDISALVFNGVKRRISSKNKKIRLPTALYRKKDQGEIPFFAKIKPCSDIEQGLK